MEEISTSTASLEKLPGKSTSSPPAVAADGSTHETFSYSKLPEETLNLSIRKLDGSSFGAFFSPFFSHPKCHNYISLVFVFH